MTTVARYPVNLQKMWRKKGNPPCGEKRVEAAGTVVVGKCEEEHL
jgi:hypothetical protein